MVVAALLMFPAAFGGSVVMPRHIPVFSFISQLFLRKDPAPRAFF
jgi:hypothetical protein